MTSWDSPDADPVGDIRRTFERLEEQHRNPQTPRYVLTERQVRTMVDAGADELALRREFDVVPNPESTLRGTRHDWKTEHRAVRETRRQVRQAARRHRD